MRLLNTFRLTPMEKPDLTGLTELTGGDKKLMAKYIGIFIDTAPAALTEMQTALGTNDHRALYTALHTIKSRVELMGLRAILTDIKNVEAGLLKEEVISAEVKVSIEHISKEINLACSHLDEIRKHLA
jgi:HPt (histidine-containing phosphotransfer) domain-containing protein